MYLAIIYLQSCQSKSVKRLGEGPGRFSLTTCFGGVQQAVQPEVKGIGPVHRTNHSQPQILRPPNLLQNVSANLPHLGSLMAKQSDPIVCTSSLKLTPETSQPGIDHGAFWKVAMAQHQVVACSPFS